MADTHDDTMTHADSKSPGEGVASTGRAVRLTRFGGPEVLGIDDVPIPQPVDDEVLVRVHAASVNPVDGKTRAGEFPPVGEGDLPVILGRDLAGTIEAVAMSTPFGIAQSSIAFTTT
jgi:NADPH:quinone reductase-like Zn-dependent oxidoreductase